MHELLVELVADGRLEAARACRRELAGVSAERSRVAERERSGLRAGREARA